MWFIYIFLVGPVLAMICSVIIGVVFDTFGLSLTKELTEQIVLFFWLIFVVIYFLHPKYIKLPFINSSINKITLSSPYILTTKTINLEEDEKIKFAVTNIGLYEGQKQSDINIVDYGDFFITTKRIVFVGDRELVSCDIEKIVTYQEFLDGFSFGVKNNEKIRYLLGFDKYEIKIKDDYKPNCDGAYLKGIIFN